MKELIKCAEALYEQIGNVQARLGKSRLDNDEEGKRQAFTEMEIAMCDVSQLLKCFIERKDNIVDLSEIWKDRSVPFEKTELVVVSNYFRTYIIYADKGDTLSSDVYDGHIYAYVSDLMPKGGK